MIRCTDDCLLLLSSYEACERLIDVVRSAVFNAEAIEYTDELSAVRSAVFNAETIEYTDELSAAIRL